MKNIDENFEARIISWYLLDGEDIPVHMLAVRPKDDGALMKAGYPVIGGCIDDNGVFTPRVRHTNNFRTCWLRNRWWYILHCKESDNYHLCDPESGEIISRFVCCHKDVDGAINIFVNNDGEINFTVE